MIIQFKVNSINGWMIVPDSLSGFGLWIAKNHDDKRAESIMVLIAKHDLEADSDERENIRRTISELLENEPIKPKI